MDGVRRRAALVACLIAVASFTGCSAQEPRATDPDPTTATPSPTSVVPPSTPTTVDPLDDGDYSAAVYVPGEPYPEPLYAGTLVDLGGGCLGLEADDGTRSLVAFPIGTVLENGRVSTVGMDAFGLGQPLRYGGWMGAVGTPTGALVVPDGCPSDVTDVWYFVAPKSAGRRSQEASRQVSARPEFEQPKAEDQAVSGPFQILLECQFGGEAGHGGLRQSGRECEFGDGDR